MKRLFQVASALLLSALLTAPAFAADFGFKSDMVCLAGGKGIGKIAPNGTLTINMNNLAPSTAFDCGVVCILFGPGLSATCTTDNTGKFSAQFPSIGICLAPGVFVEDPGFNLCVDGVVP